MLPAIMISDELQVIRQSYVIVTTGLPANFEDLAPLGANSSQNIQFRVQATKPTDSGALLLIHLGDNRTDNRTNRFQWLGGKFACPFKSSTPNSQKGE